MVFTREQIADWVKEIDACKAEEEVYGKPIIMCRRGGVYETTVTFECEECEEVLSVEPGLEEINHIDCRCPTCNTVRPITTIFLSCD